MTRQEIKAALILKGISMAEIARKFKVQPTVVSQIVAGRSRSARIQKHMAKLLGKKVKEIWPDGLAA